MPKINNNVGCPSCEWDTLNGILIHERCCPEGKKFVSINGKKFEYECSCKEHNGTCLTQAMVDALSEKAYEDA